MILGTEMTVDLKEVKNFVESDKFIQFLLNNTTDFAVAAFILQTVLEKIDEIKNGESD